MNQEKGRSGPGSEAGTLTRRDVLGRASVAAFAGTAGLCAAALVRSLLPRALPDPSLQFKIGPPDDYPEGTIRSFDEHNVMVFRDAEGLYAMSMVCTHLGCIVRRSETGRFACPCHGSVFEADGKVAKGPAPEPLAWLKVRTLPNGELAVDRGGRVAPGTKMPLPEPGGGHV